jgi:hypothetical protein
VNGSLENLNMLPVDDKLHSLADILDCRKMQALLSQNLRRHGISIRNCEISYIRYKPNTNCLISYSLDYADNKTGEEPRTSFYAKIFSEEDYSNALEKAGSHRWIESTNFPSYIGLADLQTILYFFPNDSLIDGLRLLSAPKKIQRVFYQYYEKYPEDKWRISDSQLHLETLRYKPERRAVIACRTRAKNRETNKWHRLRTIIRIYADQRGEKVFDLQNQLYNFFADRELNPIPRPICYLADRNAIFMEQVPGRIIMDLTLEELSGGVRQAASCLAGFHDCKAIAIPEKDVTDYLNDVISTLEMTSFIAPEIKGLAERAYEKLKNYAESDRPDTEGLVHGDFYYSQVLVDSDRAYIIDFDRTHRGDIISDLGNFCAHLKLQSLYGKLTESNELERNFVESYETASGKSIEQARLNFWTAYSLMQLSVGPFRRFEISWKTKTTEILEECLNILNRL